MAKLIHIVLWTERLEVRELEKKYEKTEEDLKAVQSVGQIVAEVLRQLDDERCEFKFPLCSLCYSSLLLSFLREYHALDYDISSLSKRKPSD